MTVSNQSNRVSAVGNDAVGQAVPFSFPITATSDLKVYQRVTATAVQTTLTETTNYTVAITGDTGGTVTTVTAVASTAEIHVVRDTPNTQSLDLTAGGPWNPERAEDAWDKATKTVIENKDTLARTMRIPQTDATSINMELPSSIDRASKYLTFDADGEPAVTVDKTTGTASVSAYGETLIDDATAAAAQATLLLKNSTANLDLNSLTLDTVYDCELYADFATAITTIGATPGELHIRTTKAVAADVTVPATLSLVFHKAGILQVATTKTVTINGPVVAGRYQIFDLVGTGVVAGSMKVTAYLPEWWGVVGDGVTDATTDINACLTAASASTPDVKVDWAAGTFLISDPITIGAFDVWQGKGRTDTIISLADATAVVNLNDDSAIRDIGIIGTDTAGQIGLQSQDDSKWNLYNVRVSDCDIGLDLYDMNNGVCFACDFKSNVTAGVRINAASTAAIHGVFIGCEIADNGTGVLGAKASNEMRFVATVIQGNTSYGIRTITNSITNWSFTDCHIESNGTGGEMSIEAGYTNLTIANCRIDMEDTNGKGVVLAGTGVSALLIGNRFSGGDADDVALTIGASCTYTVLMGNSYSTTNATHVTDNSDGHTAICDDATRDIKPAGKFVAQVETFTDSDTTPSVALGNSFVSNTTGVTITRFDSCVAGQMFSVISKGAIVYDTSSASRLIGSSVDITTASGDTTLWICETGGTAASVCRLLSWIDVSADNS